MRAVDRGKIQRIMRCLRRHPEGTYVSEISRETGLAKSTVSYLLTHYLADSVKEVKTGMKGLFKIIKLKS